MSDSTSYVPPKVWKWENQSGGKFTNINRPISGSTHEKELPIGKHPLQLYSLGTPNGIKITVLLEELLALGHEGAEYDAFLINIGEGAQFGSGFVEINPNSKPTDPSKKAECMSWFFWSMGSSPYLGGGFGHFYAYAPEKFEYPINRFAMEVKRQLDVLDQNLSKRQYLSGDAFNIADIAVHSWYGTLILRNAYNSAEFLDLASYKNVVRWAEEIAERPAYKRGSRVNRAPSPKDNAIVERHDASDLD